MGAIIFGEETAWSPRAEEGIVTSRVRRYQIMKVTLVGMVGMGRQDKEQSLLAANLV